MKKIAQAGTVTRLFHKLQKAKADGDDYLDIPQLEKQIESLCNVSEAYIQVHNADDEEKTLVNHMETVEEAELLAQLLITTASLYNDACTLKNKVQDLKGLVGESPDKCYLSSRISCTRLRPSSIVHPSSCPGTHLGAILSCNLALCH